MDINRIINLAKKYMFYERQLNGALLPSKTLCMTFDDGPGSTSSIFTGPKTLEIAEYLYSKKIPATFFMIGRHILEFPNILPQIVAYGHSIGNHTYSHEKAMPELLGLRDEIVNEVKKTDLLITKFNCKKKYFRAPWGIWSKHVAFDLNENFSESKNYIGPIYWDIDGDDWKYWENQGTPTDCANNYLSKIKFKNKGIVLMHDSSADLPNSKNNNKTFQTLKILIPELIQHGYKFVGLENVPTNFVNDVD